MKENSEVQSALKAGQAKVAATGFLSLFSLIGIMFYGLTFFYDFWVQEFGWTRATVTSGNAFAKILVGLFGFVVGYLIDRFGPRKMMLAGVLMAGGAVIGLGLMTSLWQFYVFYIFSALGYMCGGPLPNQVLTSRWFDKARGKAMGFAYLGIGIGGMLAPQIAKALNVEFGFRHALVILGVTMIVLSFPMAWFVKDNPPQTGEKSGSDKPEVPTKDIKAILKTRAFYLLLIGSMCSIGAVSATSQNLKLFFSLDLKYSQQQAANVLSLILAASIFGRLFMGWLADQIEKKYVMLLIYCLVACAIPLLHFAHVPGVIYVFAIVFGIGLGGDYMIIPLMAAELFGVRVMGRVMGIVLTGDGLAEAIAPWMVGWIRDISGSYANGFSVLIVLAVVGIITVILTPKRMPAN
ncbi:MFS transporter [Daejeonella sp. H1SJ63]|jgi:sugar phosphate permease|uniref:MFS transporter n=1 Tax=Daejeonella sp. H1SJ63 TaxID=3034145 RepID=UPI0023EC1678|nr:MFS transporter [Daejeonella sp. H1SJ63]